jgi:hypothetical protein
LSARRLLIMLTAIGGIFVAPVAAHAESGYPIDPPASAVSRGTIPAGESVVFSGKGFLPGESIAIDVSFAATGAAFHTSELTPAARFVNAAFTTVTASSTGRFSTPLTLSHSGRATLTATGATSGVVVNEQVTVVVAEQSGSGGAGPALPTTGEPASHWLNEIGLGLGAIFVGGMLLFALRSRGRRTRQS